MTVTAPVTQRYRLGPVKPWTQTVSDFLGNKFGIATEYGWRQQDQFPDHPTGHATDFMISGPDQGQALADYAVENNQALGVKYVIWNRQVWTAAQGWHPYTSTPNPHTDHVHITFYDSGTGIANVTGAQSATLTAAGGPDTCQWNINFPVAGDTCVLSKKTTRVLAGGIFMASGAIILMFGATLLMVYALKRTGATKILPKQLRGLV